MKFTPSHEWIHIENDVGIVGITRCARQELGEIVYVELPQIGKKIQAGEEICILESTKAAADIYSPVSGVVVAVNELLKENTHNLNAHPEDLGWLYKISLENLSELDTLMNQNEYAALVGR